MNRQELEQIHKRNPDRVYLYKAHSWERERPCVIREFVEIQVPIRSAYGTKYKTQLGARIQYWEADCWKETDHLGRPSPTWKFTARWTNVPFRWIISWQSESMETWVANKRDVDAQKREREQEIKDCRPRIKDALSRLGLSGVHSWDDHKKFALDADFLALLEDAISYRESVGRIAS